MSFEGLPIRSAYKGLKRPKSAGERSADAMFSAGEGHRPKKAPQSDGVPCPKCGKAHRGGTICNFAKGTSQFHRALADLVKGGTYRGTGGKFAPGGKSTAGEGWKHSGGRPRGSGTSEEKKKKPAKTQEGISEASPSKTQTGMGGSPASAPAEDKAIESGAAYQHGFRKIRNAGGTVEEAQVSASAAESAAKQGAGKKEALNAGYKAAGFELDKKGKLRRPKAGAGGEKESAPGVDAAMENLENAPGQGPPSEAPPIKPMSKEDHELADIEDAAFESALAGYSKDPSIPEHEAKRLANLDADKAGDDAHAALGQAPSDVPASTTQAGLGDGATPDPSDTQVMEAKPTGPGDTQIRRSPPTGPGSTRVLQNPPKNMQGPSGTQVMSAPPKGMEGPSDTQVASAPPKGMEEAMQGLADAPGQGGMGPVPSGADAAAQMQNLQQGGKQEDLAATGAGKQAAAQGGKQLAGADEAGVEEKRKEAAYQQRAGEGLQADVEKYGDKPHIPTDPHDAHFTKEAGPAAYKEGEQAARAAGFDDPVALAMAGNRQWSASRDAYSHAKQQGIPVEQVKGNEAEMASAYRATQGKAPGQDTAQFMQGLPQPPQAGSAGPGDTQVMSRPPSQMKGPSNTRVVQRPPQNMQGPSGTQVMQTPPANMQGAPGVTQAMQAPPAGMQGATGAQVTGPSGTQVMQAPPAGMPAQAQPTGSQTLSGFPGIQPAPQQPGATPSGTTPPGATPSGAGSPGAAPPATPGDGTPPMRQPGRPQANWPGIGFQSAFSTGQAIGGAAGPGAVVSPTAGFAAQQVHGMLTPGASRAAPKGVSPVTARPAGSVQQSALKSMDALINWKNKYEQRAR